MPVKPETNTAESKLYRIIALLVAKSGGRVEVEVNERDFIDNGGYKWEVSVEQELITMPPDGVIVDERLTGRLILTSKVGL